MTYGRALAAKRPKHTPGRKRGDMKRTVLVTGANRGIGLAIARQLAELGHSVLLGSRDLKAGEDAAKSLRRPGTDIEPVHMDLSDPAAIDVALNNIRKSRRHIDASVNN